MPTQNQLRHVRQMLIERVKSTIKLTDEDRDPEQDQHSVIWKARESGARTRNQIESSTHVSSVPDVRACA